MTKLSRDLIGENKSHTATIIASTIASRYDGALVSLNRQFHSAYHGGSRWEFYWNQPSNTEQPRPEVICLTFDGGNFPEILRKLSRFFQNGFVNEQQKLPQLRDPRLGDAIAEAAQHYSQKDEPTDQP